MSDIPSIQQTLLGNSVYIEDPIDDEPMVEEAPGIWTWRERRMLLDGSTFTVTRCHVDAPSNLNDPFMHYRGAK
jgi:hypothetical protein